MSRNFSAIVGFVLLCLVVYLWIALMHNAPADSALGWSFPVNSQPENAGGQLGAQVSDYLLTYLGWGSYFCVASLFVLAVIIFEQRTLDHAIIRSLGWWVTLLGLLFFFSLSLRTFPSSLPYGPGGYFGELLYKSLIDWFAFSGCLIISMSLVVSGGLMFAENAIFQLFHAIVYRPARRIYRIWFSAKWLQGAEQPASDAVSELPPVFAFGTVSDVSTSDSKAPLSKAPGLDKFQRSAIESVATAGSANVTSENVPSENRSSLAFPGNNGDNWFGWDEADPATAGVTPKGAGWSFFGWGKSDPGKGSGNEDAPDSSAAKDIQQAADNGSNFGVGRKTPGQNQTEVLNLKEMPEISSPYELPSLELLDPAEAFNMSAYESEIEENSRLLETTCADFGINVQVVAHQTGPVLTMYEIQRERGTRLHKITSLASDLAVAMKAAGVRVVAPLPNRATIGIEIPNQNKKSVRLREVIENSFAASQKMSIPIFLGGDVSGEAMCADLAKLPHLLIAGQTGSGKSVCLHSIIVSMLMTRAPEEVRMIMIDPKMVELSQYKDIPHLMYPVVTDMKKAEAILAWAVNKMEDRYSLLARVGVRNISNYNALDHDELMERARPENDEDAQQIPDKMPFIVIIVDEFADMMMTCPKEVESHITRLAQKSRAVGIHLILATQKPTRDVITGLIKSNLPARISFKVTCLTDSRVVFDASGAERLLGAGDMLFLKPGTSLLIRGQGAYLDDREIDKIIRFVKRNGPMYDDIQLPDEERDTENSYEKLAARDELYPSAIELIVNEGRGSTSFLQTKLGIGYSRAARLIELMEQDRIVGGHNGGKPREVLLSPEEWEIMKRQKDSPLTSIRKGSAGAGAGFGTPAPFTPITARPGSGIGPGSDSNPFEKDESVPFDEDSKPSEPAWKKEPEPVDLDRVNAVNYSQLKSSAPSGVRTAAVRDNEKTPKVVADGAGGEYEAAVTEGRRTPARFVKTIRVDNPSRTPEAASAAMSSVRAQKPISVASASVKEKPLVSAMRKEIPFEDAEEDGDSAFAEDYFDDLRDDYEDLLEDSELEESELEESELEESELEESELEESELEESELEESELEESELEESELEESELEESPEKAPKKPEPKMTRLRSNDSYSDEESRILDEISRSARAYLKK